MDTVKKPTATPSLSPYLKNGQAAVNARNMTEAVVWFEKAVRENPKDAQALACYGQALCWVKQHSLGIEHLRKAGALLAKAGRKQRDTRQLLLLVEQLQFWNDYPGSLELIKQAVQIKKDVRGFQLLAHTYSRLNQNQLALAASLQALRQAPDDAVLNLQHAMLEAGKGCYDDAVARLLRILRTEAGEEQAFRAHKELARIYDRQGEYARVFAHLHAAAALSTGLPALQKQEPRFVFNLLAEYTAGFDAELLRRWSGVKWREEKRAPAFLIGFFRSGTTLTQEILSTNPNVFVSDETDLVVAMKDELNRISAIKDNLAEQLRQANQDTIQHLRDFYWRLAAQRYGEHAIQGLFVDKTTMNTFDVGLINAVFPDAKVIFMVRDPRDVCLSCYMQVMIPSSATVHLFNWRSTAELYAETMQWWLHVKPLLSVDVFTFRYEDGIADFQGTFSRVFEFLGLAWHRQADQFYKQAGQKFIASPSFGQVSQPLYASSVERWRYYAAEFDAVDDLLQPYIKAYGYCADVSDNAKPAV